MAARVVESVARIHSPYTPETGVGKLAGTLPLVLCRRGSGFGEPLTVSQLLAPMKDFPSDSEGEFSSVLTSQFSKDLAAARKMACLLLGLELGTPDAKLGARFKAIARQKSALEKVDLVEALDLLIEGRIKPRFPEADLDKIWYSKRDEFLSHLRSYGAQHDG